MSAQLTTLEVELALMKALNFRQNMIVPNVSWGISDGIKDLHECDLLVLSKSHYATEIEIKVTKHDLLRDKHKSHAHDHSYIKQLYYAVPKKLQNIALDNIPERAGLYVINQSIRSNPDEKDNVNQPVKYFYTVERIRMPMKNNSAHKWTESEVLQLLRLGSMRIYTMKNAMLRQKRPGLITFFKTYVYDRIQEAKILGKVAI